MPKCDYCGKYMKQEIGSSFVFVPDSEVSNEEIAFRCKKCTEMHGAIKPYQNVVEKLCCGVIK